MQEFNPDSPTQLSILLFGGTVKDESVEPVFVDGSPVIIKSGKNKGQIKTQKVIRDKEIKGLGLKPLKEWQTKKVGVYQTNEEVLSSIVNAIDADANYTTYPQNQIDAYKVCKILLKIRELNKLLSTYYESVEELIYDVDSCVHPHFTHVSTDTGRLSCSKPNVQNVPQGNNNVTQHFTSRFPDGLIVAADYSSLEVRIEAQLSGDNEYIKDINNNVDVHTKNLALKKRTSYERALELVSNGEWEHERKMVKPFTFVMQYGGGVAAVAKKSGMTEDEVKDLLEARKAAFPRLYLYYDWIKDLVEKQGWYKDPWGRRYNFKKYEAPNWLKRKGIKETYSPTEVKNYRTQGYATGTIVPIMVGLFWRNKALHNRDKYLLVNTIHDSLMLDVKNDNIEIVKKDLSILETCGIISEQYFNYEFKVPITIDIKHGKSWSEC